MIATASPIAAGEEQALVLVDASAARDFIAGRTAKRDNATSDHVSMLTAKSFVSFRYECVWGFCMCVCVCSCRCVWKTKRDYFKNLFIMQWVCVCVYVCVGYACFALFALSLWKWKFALVFLCAHLVRVCETVKSRSFCSRCCCCFCCYYFTLCCAQRAGEGKGKEGTAPRCVVANFMHLPGRLPHRFPWLPQALPPFLLATRILSALLFSPLAFSFPQFLSLPFLFAVYYSLVVELNKVLSRGAFVVLTFECFWHLCKFVLISLLHTANWHVFKWHPHNVECKVGNSSKCRDLRRVCHLNSWESY